MMLCWAQRPFEMTWTEDRLGAESADSLTNEKANGPFRFTKAVPGGWTSEMTRF